ncbi:spermidine synthase [Streptomyces ovatisporus]|uniref:Spermidine synthase n=1 Tax=Streptomyces ovatisporus TaxID=1128682 RepID=A0ABV9AFJ8_9ACTN
MRTVDSGSAKLMPDVDQPDAWLLTVDGTPQSYVDLRDPTHLEFEYTRRVAHVLDLAAPAGQPLDVLHLGGGALTLPRYVAATRPGSRQRVAETDEALSALVGEHLPLPEGSGVGVEALDARSFLDASPAESADIVIADVYGGVHVPAHLTTLGYARAACRVLRPHGLYVANLADSAPFPFVGAQLATLGEVFTHLCLMAEPSVLRGRRFGNTVLVAAHEPLPLAELSRRAASDVFPARVESGPALARFSEGRTPVQDGDATPSPVPPRGAFTIG